jgi:hypothetical protein
MPTLSLISASETFDPPVDRTRKLHEVKRELKAVSTAISNAKTEDEAVYLAATLWSREGRQTKQFREAVRNCVSLGLTRSDVARHICQSVYPESVIENTHDVKYKHIYRRVEYALQLPARKGPKLSEASKSGFCSALGVSYDSVASKLDIKSKSNVTEGADANVAHGQLTRDFRGLDIQEDGQKQAANASRDSSFSSQSSSSYPTLHSLPSDGESTRVLVPVSDVFATDSSAVAVAIAVAESSSSWSSLSSTKAISPPSSPPSHDSSDIELEYYMQMILDYSHRQAGSLYSHSSESGAAGRRRAKMLTEHPEEAKSFVCMILRDYPYLDSLKIIQMVDYCSMWLSNDISGYV